MSFDKSLEYISNTQTLIGKQTRKLVDPETGEIFEVEQITKRTYGQKHFWKIYLSDFLQLLGLAESKQIDVIIHILENTNSSNNTFIGTDKQIAKNANVSEPTIAKIMKKLQEKQFIKKVQNGVWQISADIMMKGNEHKKQLLLNYYDEEK